MQAYRLPVASVSTVDFLPALTTNQASATVNLKLPTNSPNHLLRAITLASKENLTWELWFFSRAINLGQTLLTDYFIGGYQFPIIASAAPAGFGYSVDDVGASPNDPYFYHYVDKLEIPLLDLDRVDDLTKYAALHVRLINRSAASKSANATGAVKLTCWVSNIGQQP